MCCAKLREYISEGVIIENIPAITTLLEQGVLNIKLNVRMNSASQNEFINTCIPLNAGVTKFVIDMTNCDYIDSFGLGALIVLFDYALINGATVVLINVRQSFKKIFTLAEFEQLLEITYLP